MPTISATTLADTLVFKRLTAVTQYGLEAAKIVLDAIHELKLTGRVEFLAGDLFHTGNYALCVGFEPAKGFRLKKFEDFWEPLRNTVQKHCKINGHLELEYWDCESFAISRFRKELMSQGTIPFEDGLPLALPNGDEVQSLGIYLAIKEGRGLKNKSTTTPPPPSPATSAPATVIAPVPTAAEISCSQDAVAASNEKSGATKLTFAGQKLTKKYFLALPEGYFVVSNVFPFEKFVTSPQSERAAQWQTIPKNVRYRLCSVHQQMSDAPLLIQQLAAHSSEMQAIHLSADNLENVNQFLKSFEINHSTSCNQKKTEPSHQI